MPIRIKPVHDFGPCILTLESIQGIIELVERDFSSPKYSADDGIWQVFDDPKDSFLVAISQRQTLDSFRVKAKVSKSGNDKSVELVFDKDEARIECNANPDQNHWFEHFLIDIKKHIRPPSFSQIAIYRGMGSREFYLRIPLLFIPLDTSVAVSTPYCKIVIRKKAPDPFRENIKANLVSNAIWAIMVFILGVLLTLITTGQLKF